LSDNLTIMDGSTFFVSDERGDAVARLAEGLFVSDVRHLSKWRLLVNGEPIFLLSSRTVGYDRARIFGTLAGSHIGQNPPVTLSRDRRVHNGVTERISLESHTSREQQLHVDVCFGSDFIDIFEARHNDLASASARDGRKWTDHDHDAVTLRHQQDGFARSTKLTFDVPFELLSDRARFHVTLGPRARWVLSIFISCEGDGVSGQGPGERDAGEVALHVGEAPLLETEQELLDYTYTQSVSDLVALSLPPNDGEAAGAPAAGLPWFMTLFGRDSLITAYQSLPFLPGLARGALLALARLQADADDGFRDAEPGKILHELRRGKLAELGKVPHTPYYGSHDATPLFLVLLDEYERWTGDIDLVNGLEDAARRALAWIETHGDLDGDGFLEYNRRSPLGLENQCWKDSSGSVLFADGTRARGPLALCEIQGYAYDARRRMARLCRMRYGDAELAERLEDDAQALKRRFNEDFWCEARGHFALALDGEKDQVDSLTSNTGHLLWSGIVDEERGVAVVDRLMASDVYNGWGLRTLSSNDDGYNPIGYHIGTVWPHDTGIAAEGMRRYGFHTQASRLAGSLLDAAAFFGHRLPEVFAGFDREETGMPVEYPTASRPQAWAAGATLLALRTLLGLDVQDGRLRSRPTAPEIAAQVRLRRVSVRGELFDVPERR
jgi:glycogen debranching enzyme